jgi:UDP-N-acetyl-2-amino-2-deoxyglucuronate dehydrogenase
MRNALEDDLLGDIRSVTLTQRWQRPIGYFKDWRGKIEEGGKSLYEYTIHYLDIIDQLFGSPKVFCTKTFNHKHMDIPFDDTLYSIVQYSNGASGSIEVNVAVEPHNLECSLELIGSKGFLHVGGNALDEITRVEFENEEDQKKWESMEKKAGKALTPNSYGTHVGSCPNHPMIYEKIAEGTGFPISDAIASIKFIENVYAKEEK